MLVLMLTVIEIENLEIGTDRTAMTEQCLSPSPQFPGLKEVGTVTKSSTGVHVAMRSRTPRQNQ